jgi:hypothetical protein
MAKKKSPKHKATGSFKEPLKAAKFLTIEPPQGLLVTLTGQK